MVSSDIVGYQNIKISSGYSIMTPTFENLDTTTYDLNDIKVLAPDGNEIDSTSFMTYCNGAVKINKINSVGNYTETYSFYALNAYGNVKNGWFDNNGNEATGVVLSKGEALLVNNGYAPLNAAYQSIPTNVYFQVKGTVDLKNTNVVPTGYSLYGNSTPERINLADIAILNADGEEIDSTSFMTYCNGAVKINKINSVGNYTETYSFYALNAYGNVKNGWFDNSGNQVTAETPIYFEPGEAFLMNNGYAPLNESYVSVPSAVVIKLPSPLAQ